MTEKILLRFWSKVKKTEPESCWFWTGAVDKDGYGMFGVCEDGRKRTLKAHRLSLSLSLNRELSASCLHSCDHPSCVNPLHLREGTQQDNIDDCLNRKRFIVGEDSKKAKLNEEQVLEIFSLRVDGFSLKEISSRFGVSEATVSRIANAKKWKHIHDRG